MKINWRVLLGIMGLVSLKFNFSLAAADFSQSAVLPKGRHQVVFRFGSTQSVQEKYASDGTLQSVGRKNVRMDNKFLKSNKDLRDAIKLINAQSPNENLGNDLDVGTLEFKGSAQFNYFSPQFARGLTENWTLGLGVPFVNFKSDVQGYSSGVNTTNRVFQQLSSVNKTAKLSEKLEYMKSTLNLGPTGLFNRESDAKGYKRVTDRDLSFVGDVVLGSIYRLRNAKYWDLYLQNYLTLPTGPEDDPDDLVDPSNFHKTKFETSLYNNIDLNRYLKFGFSAGYTWNVETSQEVRVPTSESDALPDLSSKEKVSKDPGDEVSLKAHIYVSPIRDTEIGFGYEKSFQQADDYSGSRGTRYDLLEKDTNSEYDSLKFKAVYTTVDSYVQGVAPIPLSFTYAFSDIIRGVNVERETTHELLMKMYF